jgi:hypothetical protein
MSSSPGDRPGTRRGDLINPTDIIRPSDRFDSTRPPGRLDRTGPSGRRRFRGRREWREAMFEPLDDLNSRYNNILTRQARRERTRAWQRYQSRIREARHKYDVRCESIRSEELEKAKAAARIQVASIMEMKKRVAQEDNENMKSRARYYDAVEMCLNKMHDESAKNDRIKTVADLSGDVLHDLARDMAEKLTPISDKDVTKKRADNAREIEEDLKRGRLPHVLMRGLIRRSVDHTDHDAVNELAVCVNRWLANLKDDRLFGGVEGKADASVKGKLENLYKRIHNPSVTRFQEQSSGLGMWSTNKSPDDQAFEEVQNLMKQAHEVCLAEMEAAKVGYEKEMERINSWLAEGQRVEERAYRNYVYTVLTHRVAIANAWAAFLGNSGNVGAGAIAPAASAASGLESA